MQLLKGDYIGFTIGKFHSSELGILRVSDGSRFTENLLPTYTDRTATVTGRNETFYFGSDYTQKIFDIPIAFDSLTEKQLRLLKQVLSNTEPQDLIFDETPYKVYKVKINGTPNLKYICFEENGERIYKGEGTLNFIAYFPYARSRFKYEEKYNLYNIPEWDFIYNNKDEWIEASGIEEKTANGIEKDTINKENSQLLNLYNPGDIETSFVLNFNYLSTDSFIGEIKISLLNENKEEIKYFILSLTSIREVFEKNQFKSYCINSLTKIITLKNNEGLKVIVNGYITKGDIFQIPCGVSYLKIDRLGGIGSPDWSGRDVTLDYDYLYY